MARVRSDELSEAAEETSSPTRSGSWLSLAAAAILLIGLAATAALLGVRDHQHRQGSGSSLTATPAEEAALAAARAEAVALTTISYRTASADLDRVLAGATGALRSQFEAQKAQLPATLAQTKAISKGTVLSSALSSLAGNQAKALLAVDQTVSGTDTSTSGVLKHYRMVVTLQQVNGKWLASDVSFDGLPQ